MRRQRAPESWCRGAEGSGTHSLNMGRKSEEHGTGRRDGEGLTGVGEPGYGGL